MLWRVLGSRASTSIWASRPWVAVKAFGAAVGGFAGEYGQLVGFYLFPGDRNPLCLVPEPPVCLRNDRQVSSPEGSRSPA